MPEKDGYDVAGRDDNEPRKTVHDMCPMVVEVSPRRRPVLVCRMGVELQFDPLRHASADAVMRRLEGEAYAARGEVFLPEVEAHQLDIVRQSQMRHVVERDREHARREIVEPGKIEARDSADEQHAL